MELREYFRILRDQWLLVLATLLAVIAGAALVTLLQTPKYTASTDLFFSLVGGESVSDVAQGGYYSTNQMESYARVAMSPLVLEPVAAELRYPGGAEALRANTVAQAPPQTVVMTVSVTDPDPALAARAANEIGAATIGAVANLSTDDGSQVRVKATTLARAAVPEGPSEPNALRNLAAAAAAGLLLGWGVAFVRSLLDNKIRSADDIKRISSQLPILGSIPSMTTDDVIMLEEPRSPTAEAYRRMATNLRFITLDSERNSVLISSSVQGEGKSTTVANLAIALAEAGLDVLLVDADLRRPTIANRFGLEGAVGLTTVLSGQAVAEDVLQPTGVDQLTVLAAGQLPPNPSSLLGSRRMQGLFDWAQERYQVVLVDSPPLLPVTDAAVLAPQVGSVVLVVSAGSVTKPEVSEALGALERVDSPASGYLLNRADQHLGARAYEYHRGVSAAT